MLCPAKYLANYIKDPHGMKAKFDSVSLKVTKHIFTSPSSALKAGVSSRTRACNAKLHGMKEVGAEHIAYAAVQCVFYRLRFAISLLEKWKDHDGLFYYTDFYTRIVNLIRARKDEGWVDSLLGHYNEKLFGNENDPQTQHLQSSALNNQQESHRKSLPPPNRSPSPDPPVAQALANPREDKQPSPLPPLSPQESDDEGHVLKSKEKVLPAHPPTPDPPINSRKRKQASMPIAATFDDDSPLMEEDEEITQPTKRK
ncbi:hypothetical protein EDB19DRAFT_1983178 [Suillus lakei]|nr:hypothetical protein EDB19DRAFT_1983178 [Suillus lakei]